MSASTDVLNRFLPQALSGALQGNLSDPVITGTVRRYLPTVVADAIINDTGDDPIYRYMPKAVADAVVTVTS